MLTSPQVKRIYLDELQDVDSQSVGIGLIQLVVKPEAVAIEQAKRIIERAWHDEQSVLSTAEIINLVVTIAFYKFQRNRQEIERMLGINLEETPLYKEVKEEGKAEGKAEGREEAIALALPELLKMMPLEAIAEIYKVSVEDIQRITKKYQLPQ